jgi:hypothetical protein
MLLFTLFYLRPSAKTAKAIPSGTAFNNFLQESYNNFLHN